MPENEDVKNTVLIVAGAATIAYGIFEFVNVVKKERKKREQIEANKNLDMLALQKASIEMTKRIQEDAYSIQKGGLAKMLSDFDNELAFQKIVVREEN